ncbi:unnamed protein product [Moneuplotes crassus]|uniref:Vacuolar fusion protein MON1 homolog n=2 Tax=Euplotes crassus TaxID=5936 RepID=A0AAD1UJV5_EUPCR|nr:unnamed protein product [Moneuplotes crassus]
MEEEKDSKMIINELKPDPEDDPENQDQVVSKSPVTGDEGIFPTIVKSKEEEEEENSEEASAILNSKKRLDVNSLEESEEGAQEESKASFSKLSIDVTEEDSIREHAYNYFIFTLAGKPIFCRFGDEFHLSPMFATFSAMIPKILSFYSNNEFYKDRNFLRCIRGKKLKCVVLIKSQICYVAITKYKETTSYLRQQLEYLHLQMVSLITNQILESLKERPNLDIRNSVAGLEKPLHMMSEMVKRSPACFLNAFPVLTLHSLLRKDLYQLIEENKPNDFYYGLLVTYTTVLGVIENKEEDAMICAPDINLIFNYIHSLSSFRHEETWTPICIPGITEEFLLHVYVYFLNPHFGVVYISTSDQIDVFYEYSKSAKALFSEVQELKIINHLENWSTRLYQPIDMKEITCAIIRNDTLDQFIHYNLPKPRDYTQEHVELLARFEEMYSRCCSFSNKKTFYLVEKEEYETYVIHRNHSVGSFKFTLLLRLNESITEKQIHQICDDLLIDLKQPKKSLFINTKS